MTKTVLHPGITLPKQSKRLGGFSLLELMVAMGVFLIVGGAAVGLIRKHAPLYATQQNQAGLNIGIRNVVAQMQIDVVNAGSGYYPGANMPNWPVGITIINGANTNGSNAGCFDTTTFNYNGSCYDQLHVIEADSTMPSARPSSDSTGLVAADTASPDLYLTFSPPPTPAQLTLWAAKFNVSDQILLVQGVTGTPLMSTAVLTANANVVGNSIHLQHAASTTVGCSGAAGGTAKGIPAADSLKIYDIAECERFTNSFDPKTDYVLKLSATIYKVDVTDPTNPKLVRQVGLAGTPSVIADQIVNFKIGAWSTNWSPANANAYSFNVNDFNSDWATIKSIRVNLAARTPPNSDPNNAAKNSYDQGPYQVQAVSVVINPRNLSMQ